MLDTNPADVNVMLNCGHHLVYIHYISNSAVKTSETRRF